MTRIVLTNACLNVFHQRYGPTLDLGQNSTMGNSKTVNFAPKVPSELLGAYRRGASGTEMWKFAIDIGRRTKCACVGLKRPDKDWFEAAPPKSKLFHSVAVTNCRLDFRTPLDSLAKGPHLLAGKLVVILNSEPTRTNQKSALDRCLAAWFGQISKPVHIWKEKRSQMWQLTSGPKK